MLAISSSFGAAMKPTQFTVAPVVYDLIDAQSLPPSPSTGLPPSVGSMLTIRNVAIGAGLALAAYVAYALLSTPKKKKPTPTAAAIAGWLNRR